MGDDERRFRRILLWVLAISVLAGLIIPFLPVNKRKHHHPSAAADRQTGDREGKAPTSSAATQTARTGGGEAQAKTRTQTGGQNHPNRARGQTKPEPKAAPKPSVAKAREKASRSGVLAFTDELADLRDKPVAAQLEAHGTLSKGSKQPSIATVPSSPPTWAAAAGASTPAPSAATPAVAAWPPAKPARSPAPKLKRCRPHPSGEQCQTPGDAHRRRNHLSLRPQQECLQSALSPRPAPQPHASGHRGGPTNHRPLRPGHGSQGHLQPTRRPEPGA